MSEQSTPRRTKGFRAFVILLTILASVLALLMADQWRLSGNGRLGWAFALIAVVALILILIEPLIHSSWDWIYGRAFQSEKRGLEPQRKNLKRDARLQYLCDELRASRGWFWRYRMPWLMVCGADDLTASVAPGLKQAGVLPVGNAILVHPAPDGVEVFQWRRQIRKLRRRRPVDSVVQVVQLDGDGRPDSELPHTLATLATDFGWAAPVTFLHPVQAEGDQPDTFEVIGAFGGTSRKGGEQTRVLRDQLAMIEVNTANVGIRLGCAPTRMTWLLKVSAYIGQQHEHIVAGWEVLLASHRLRAPLSGVVFVPVFGTEKPERQAIQRGATENLRSPTTTAPGAWPDSAASQPVALLPVWHAIASRRGVGRRVGFYWPNALAKLVAVAAIAWCVWMTVSFIGNRQLMREARAAADAAVDARPQTAQAWRAQVVLQQLMEKLEYRQQHGAPWYLRGGLSRNDEVLAALWQPYRIAATRNLQAPVVKSTQDLLKFAGEARADALQSQDARSSTYNALKTYLMLADPRRADPAFLKRLFVALWPKPVEIPVGERDDTGRRLAGFYADHLKAHPEWRIALDDGLVTSTRNMLVTQMGLASADDTVYQRILDEVKGKYADASLDTLLNRADAHGLFTTSQTVPGIYTRAAWDGMIAAAIDKASSERRVSSDWVLTDAQSTQSIDNTPSSSNGASSGALGAIRAQAAIDEKHAADALKQRLTTRYFAEYTAAWQRMLNSLQWQPASNLTGAIEQLARLADAQTSPLIALMKSVQYQAQAGRPSQALSDTLVRKAQSLIGNDDSTAASTVNPLDKPFGPLLALMGDTGATPVSGNDKGNATADIALNGVSLSRYLTAVTTMRLKLQQIASGADAQAMARSLAQAVFQGKLSELSQARDDAALTAASLGSAWSGFGDAAFAQPLEAAWQTILQPAAASLNEAWRASVAAPFNAAMSGRYPFFDTQADASFAELGRYVRPDTGLIARFVSTQLAGVLKLEGDHWIPSELAPQALQFDPKFLAGIRLLSTVGAQLYARGDAGERIDMMALPVPNVTRSELSIDGKQIVNFNQQESWTPFTWPGNGLTGRASLTWQTVDVGLRQAFDATGDWAFLRLLSKADVKPLDSTRYQLAWNVANGEPLRYVLRTQLGAGPLDLLKLRGFRMPERIFTVGKTGVMPAFPSLPPLPLEFQP